MPSLLYGNNADIKYPLSDFSEEVPPVPNSFLMDLSLSIPYGMEVVMGGARVGPGFAFVSFEDKTTREPIGHVLVEGPRLDRIYPLEMSVPGFGWVVFGPAAVRTDTFPAFRNDIAVDVDPECVTALKTTAPVFKVTKNTFDREVRNILRILSDNDIISVRVAENSIFLERNDTVLSAEDILAFTERQIDTENLRERVLFTLGGVAPDESGNVDIDIEGCMSPCNNTRELPIPRGDTGTGVSGELPLDVYQSRDYLPDDPCNPQPSLSPAESSDPFDGCQGISKEDILDFTAGDKAVGTLYTIDTETESSGAL